MWVCGRVVCVPTATDRAALHVIPFPWPCLLTLAFLLQWHLGMAAWEQTPTFRGYNSFHGFYSGGQDYFTHMEGGGFDLHIDSRARCGANCSQMDHANKGTYSTHLYADTAVRIIEAHAASANPAPIFLYLAFQAVHSPDQVPQSYIDPYNATIQDLKRRTFAGMLSCLDEAVGNVTAALDAAGMTDNSLIIFVSDNGEPGVAAWEGCVLRMSILRCRRPSCRWPNLLQ